MESTLEARYGRLLLTYPAGYRRERGAEMLGTLMESARPGQRWPSLADAIDLLAGGIRHRAGLSAIPGLARGLALAGPIALVCAGGLGAYYMIAEFTAAAVGFVRPIHRGWGPLPTLGPIMYAAWILAALGRVALPRLASRWLTGSALAVLVLVVVVAHAAGRTRPSLPLIVPLGLFGLLALAGTAHAASRRERVGVAVGLVAAVGGLTALTFWRYAGILISEARCCGGAFVEATPPQMIGLAWRANTGLTVAGLAVLVLLLGLLVAGARHRPALWSAALLLVPGLPLVALLVPEIGGFQFSNWSLMPVGLIAGATILASAIGLARPDPVSGAPLPTRTATEGSLAVAGTFALGTAATMALVAWIMLRWEIPEGSSLAVSGWRQSTVLVWALAALGSVLPLRWAGRVGVAAAVAATIAMGPVIEVDRFFTGAVGRSQSALIALGVVALVGLPAAPPRRAGRRLLGLGAALVLGPLLAWGPTWWETGSLISPDGAILAAATALAVGVVAGGRAVIAPRSPLWWRGAVMLLVSSAWIGVTGPLYLGAWQTPLVMAGLLVVFFAVAVWAARRTRPAAPPPDAPA